MKQIWKNGRKREGVNEWKVRVVADSIYRQETWNIIVISHAEVKKLILTSQGQNL